jgi:hypothetical protein
MIRYIALACALAASSATALAAAPEATEPAGQSASKQAPQLWVNVGGFSRHFARNRGYNESNFGLGVEYRFNPELSVMAGTYYNSVRHTTTYAAVTWQPYALGSWKFGASVGVMDGYPAISGGGTFFAAVPMATYEGKRFGVNLGVIPSTGKVDGALIVQFKVRAY